MDRITSRDNTFIIVILLFISLFSSPLSVFSQKVITMENANGVFKIACSVNGAKMKMIFDTGASVVSLSETMANFLYDNGYISDEDVLGSGTSTTADGSIHNNVIINIKDIEISSLHLKNVKAVVISSQNAPLLLGQTAIQKLGKISLDGNKLIIENVVGDYSDEELKLLEKRAIDYYENDNFYASIESWLKLKDYLDLNTIGYSMLIYSLSETKQYDLVVKYGKEWENRYPVVLQISQSVSIYTEMALALEQKEETLQEAILYYEKAIDLQNKLHNNPSNTLFAIAFCYFRLNDWDSCIAYSKKAMKSYFMEYNTSEKEISTKGINNEIIGLCLYVYSQACSYKGDTSTAYYLMKLSAKCNYDEAIKYCYENNIDFNSSKALFE